MRTVVLVALAGAVVAPRARAEDPADLFRSKCMDCHVVPDPQFEVDRSWLEQVKSTA